VMTLFLDLAGKEEFWIIKIKFSSNDVFLKLKYLPVFIFGRLIV